MLIHTLKVITFTAVTGLCYYLSPYPVEGHISYFQFFTIVNSTEMNFLVTFLFGYKNESSLEYIDKYELMEGGPGTP